MFEYEEYETVQVRVPKAVLDFLRALRVNVEEYLENTIIEGFKADLNASSGPFMENIIERFPEFKRFLEGC
ncbi:hypothetical protein KEJ24_09000 [Candidatus Bathyarchaeota archaeon]|nr:hypothetical protein [Candidatus Bathyarchaeota archaeon]